MSDYTVEKLHYTEILNDEKVKKKYTELFQQAYAELQILAEQNIHNYVYRVPYIDINEPLYDITDAVFFLIKKFRAKGFYVRYCFPNFLYISWKASEKELEKIQKIKYLCVEDIKTRACYTINNTLERPLNTTGGNGGRLLITDGRTATPALLTHQTVLSGSRANYPTTSPSAEEDTKNIVKYNIIPKKR